MSTLYDRMGITKVINARGPATTLGSSRVHERVRTDIEEMLGLSVEMWELQKKASEAISRLTGAEAGCVVGCSAAGIAIAVAASMTGDDMAHIKELPTVRGGKNKIVIQKGHIIGVGDAPIHQVIRMTGAEVVEIGESIDCATYHLEASLTDEVAAAVYVTYLFGDSFPPNLLSLESFIEICKKKRIPVIVDAAYGTDYKSLISQGADIVIYSGQKWLGGATAGLICGSKDLVYACYLQENGIGRPMKVGKEGIAGVISAIEYHLSANPDHALQVQLKQATKFVERIQAIDGLSAQIGRKPHSPSIQVELRVAADDNLPTAWALNQGLAAGNPVIKVNDYFVQLGVLMFDFSFLDEGDEELIVQRIRYFIKQLGQSEGGKSYSKAQTRLDAMYDTYKKWMN
ncbi:PLP-dependent transferase [Paenibacillus nasutitermitis]|uniref:Aminotransferase class V-fold PLP-dependent enzyme n=1 Tax=Paenibacillus nasutitermitis TaxID=1652958 RepID=A0A916ZDV9_9BACL|nr:PLP-dependent transferase [Paenibacillus nasutitermitis]GGD89827.1 hypothetical protein GCM10010911_55610 [Paenibacillus nasutitermitis]